MAEFINRPEYLYCTPVKYAVKLDYGPPDRYFHEYTTVNPGGLQYKSAHSK